MEFFVLTRTHSCLSSVESFFSPSSLRDSQNLQLFSCCYFFCISFSHPMLLSSCWIHLKCVCVGDWWLIVQWKRESWGGVEGNTVGNTVIWKEVTIIAELNFKTKNLTLVIGRWGNIGVELHFLTTVIFFCETLMSFLRGVKDFSELGSDHCYHTLKILKISFWIM